MQSMKDLIKKIRKQNQEENYDPLGKDAVKGNLKNFK